MSAQPSKLKNQVLGLLRLSDEPKDDSKYSLDSDSDDDTKEVIEVVETKTTKTIKTKSKAAKASPKKRKSYPRTHKLKRTYCAAGCKSYEVFNKDKLNYILTHRDECKLADYDVEESKARKRYLQSCFGKDYDPFMMAQKYMDKSHKTPDSFEMLNEAGHLIGTKANPWRDEPVGSILVKYIRNFGIGRFHASKGISQQGMPIEIRHTIAGEYYNDLDFVNAHPNFLLYLCKLRKLETPVLKRYVENREEILKEVVKVSGISRGLAKIIFLCLLNGGQRDYKALKKVPLVLTEFRDEMLRVHKEFTKDESYKTHVAILKKRGKTHNQAASYVNVLLCDLENIHLIHLWDLVGQDPNVVLIFDGLQIPKTVKLDLPDLEAKLKELKGIDIKLSIKAMDQGYKLPSNIPKYIEEVPKPSNMFDYEDPYNYHSFHNEFHETFYYSYEQLDTALSEKYPGVIAKVLNGEGSFIKKGTNGRYDIVKTLGLSSFTMHYTSAAGRRTKITFTDYMKKQPGYNNYECKPGKSSGENFNVWSGFGAKLSNKTTDGCERIKKFLFEVWATDNQKYYDFIISWMAGIFTNLEGINKTALALISLQGCGKGFIVDFLSHLVRRTNTQEVVGVRPITQKHNTILINKRLICVNEMSSTRAEFKSSFDKMKALITDGTINVEPKGCKAFDIDNIGNYVLCTNHRDSIIVEKGDRRYTILELSAKYKGNTDFFEDLKEAAFNQETYDAFYTYLMNFKAVRVSKPIMTKIKQEVSLLSRHAGLRFLDHLKEERQDGEKGLMCLQASHMYRDYKVFCEEQGEKPCTRTKFGMAISSEATKKRKSKGIFYEF